MGYMGLSSWADSDMAADAYSQAVKALLGSLQKSLKEQHSAYNTDGYTNVALIIESGLLDGVLGYYIKENLDLTYLTTSLKRAVKHASKDDKRDLARMLKNVQALVKRVESDL